MVLDNSAKNQDVLKIVLWDVLLEIDLVLLDKIGVVGLLRCASLTLRSRQSRQVPAGAMSPLVTPSPFLLTSNRGLLD